VNYKKVEVIQEILRQYTPTIKHIQLNGLPADIDEINEDDVREILSFKLNNPEIEISLHSYPYNLAEKVYTIRESWLELAKKTLDFANKINVKFVTFHAGYALDANNRKKRDSILQIVVNSIKDLLNTSRIYNIEIHIENLYPENRGSDFTKLGDRLSDFKYFFDNIKDPLLMLCYDYGHGNLDESGIQILREYSKIVGSIHAHDNDQISDIHWPIGNPELGTINWDKELEYLKKIKFSGRFILESYIEDQIKSLKYLIQ